MVYGSPKNLQDAVPQHPAMQPEIESSLLRKSWVMCLEGIVWGQIRLRGSPQVFKSVALAQIKKCYLLLE